MGATRFYIPTSRREQYIPVFRATFPNYSCHENGWGPNTDEQTGISPDPFQFDYHEFMFLLSEANILVYYWSLAQAATATFNACRLTSYVKSILFSTCALVLYL